MRSRRRAQMLETEREKKRPRGLRDGGHRITTNPSDGWRPDKPAVMCLLPFSSVENQSIEQTNCLLFHLLPIRHYDPQANEQGETRDVH